MIRHRFLDPDASAEVIAQKLCQSGWEISIRSVQRVIEEFGLQKKTLSDTARWPTEDRDPADQETHSHRALRSGSAWNVACDSSWPTRSPATSWAFGF